MTKKRGVIKYKKQKQKKIKDISLHAAAADEDFMDDVAGGGLGLPFIRDEAAEAELDDDGGGG